MNFPASCNKFCLIGKYLFTCLQGLHRGNGWAINCSKAPCTGKAFFPVYYQGHKRSAINTNFKVCTLLYLRLCLLRYFWYKREGMGERYISQNLTWICKWISIYSPWNLSKDVCHVGILIRAGGGIYQIGFSSLWQFILIKKGLIQWFLHCCQVFTVSSHQAWWYSKHIKW